MSEKSLDFLVLGATGFTGKCVVEQLALMEKSENFSWAIAGRSNRKMKDVIDKLDNSGFKSGGILQIQTDIYDEESLRDAVRQVKIVLNCTGPNSLLSAPVVKACIETRTNYLDLSAETYHVLNIYQLYHKAAEDANTLIIPSCGFSVIPAVAGMIHLERHFQGTLHTVEGYFDIQVPKRAYFPGFSGPLINAGTWTSMVHVMEKLKGQIALKKELFPEMIELPLEMKKSFFHRHQGRFWFPYPGVENDLIDISERHLHKDNNKKYVNFKCYTTVPLLFHFLVIFAIFLYYYLCYFKCFRRLLINHPRLMSLGYASSKGPSEKARVDTKYSFVLNGKGWDIHDDLKRDSAKILSVKVSGYDPGYYTTSIAIITCALSILKEPSHMPNGGVIMPGRAFHKTSIVERLVNDGYTIEILNLALESAKRRKYANLAGNYVFEPFGVETLGPWGPGAGARSLFGELSKRLVDSTRDPKAGLYLGQRISIAIQRGNAASLLGTFPVDSDAVEFFDAVL